MFRYFEQLSTRIAAPFMAETSRNSKVWQCRCGQSLFFRNSQCLACQAALGYQPQQSRLSSLQPGPVVGTWLADDNLDAGALQQAFHVLQDLRGLCRDVIADDFLGVGVDGNLTGNEQHRLAQKGG